MKLKNNDITLHINRIHELAEEAIPVLTNEINHIIQTQAINKQDIESCLDRLLDFAFHPKAFDSFKWLCRYYINIDPDATHQYVRFYKDMYENG